MHAGREVPLRIIVICHEFPPVGGGAATLANEIGAGIAQKGHQVRVLTAAFDGLPLHEERAGPLDVYRLPAIRLFSDRSNPAEMLSFAVLGLGPALNHFRRFRPHVCITFFAVPNGLIPLVARAVTRTPYILALVGADVPGFAGVGPYPTLALPITYPVWKKASALVANSPYLKQLALRVASRIGQDVAYIPGGVDLERFQSRKKPGPGEELRLLCVARLAPQKGIEVLLKALSSLREAERSRIRLTLVGDGPLRPHLEALAERDLPGRVEFLGWQPRDQLPSIYASADVLVLPSLEEGMPTVVLEAMASRLPIIMTDVGGARELVHNGANGLVVTPVGSSEALAGALARVLREKRRLPEWGEASLRRAALFSWDRIVEQYLALAEAVVKQR